MRIRNIVLIIMVCCLTKPVFAESSEATITRVTDLEKANIILQEDLARTQIVLDTTISSLKVQTTALAQEKAAREALQKQLADEITARAQLEKAQQTDYDALLAKLDALQKTLDKQAATIAQLTTALEKEQSARRTAQSENSDAYNKLRKKMNRDRTITIIMGAALGALAISKK